MPVLRGFYRVLKTLRLRTNHQTFLSNIWKLLGHATNIARQANPLSKLQNILCLSQTKSVWRTMFVTWQNICLTSKLQMFDNKCLTVLREPKDSVRIDVDVFVERNTPLTEFLSSESTFFWNLFLETSERSKARSFCTALEKIADFGGPKLSWLQSWKFRRLHKVFVSKSISLHSSVCPESAFFRHLESEASEVYSILKFRRD